MEYYSLSHTHTLVFEMDIFHILISVKMFEIVAIDRATNQLVIIQVFQQKYIIIQNFNNTKWSKLEVVELTMLVLVLSSDIPT